MDQLASTTNRIAFDAPAHPHFLAHILVLDGESALLAIVVPADLVRSGLSNGGVQSQILHPAIGRLALHVATPFPAGARVAALASALSHQPVDGRLDASWLEGFAHLHRHVGFGELLLAQCECFVAFQDAPTLSLGCFVRIQSVFFFLGRRTGRGGRLALLGLDLFDDL